MAADRFELVTILKSIRDNPSADVLQKLPTESAMTAAKPKLPVFRSVFETWALLFRNLGFLLQVGWLWIALAIALLVGLEWGLERIGYRQFEAAFGVSDLGPIFASSLVTVACLAVVAVQWHRRILQPHTFSIALLPRLVVVYALAAFVLESCFSLLLTVSAVGTTTADITATKVLSLSALCILGIYVWGRVMLILPAIALGHDSSVHASWSATRGNGWRIFFGSLLAAVVPIMVAVLPIVVSSFLELSGTTSNSGTTAPTASGLVEKIINNSLGVLLALMAISFLSITYRELVIKPATPTLPEH
jgi:hypothetical protein